VPHAFSHKESIELLRVAYTNRSQTSVRSCTYDALSLLVYLHLSLTNIQILAFGISSFMFPYFNIEVY
jgi:hypothetical protein